MVRILLIEDDSTIAAGLAYSLEQEGWSVTCKGTLAQGRNALETGEYQLLLVDVGLPDGSGYDLCAAAKSRNIPVIFATARGDEGSVVLGLDMGADDYIVKPFRLREVASRIRAVLRRAAGEREQLVRLGELAVDTQKGQPNQLPSCLPLWNTDYCLLFCLILDRLSPGGNCWKESGMWQEILSMTTPCLCISSDCVTSWKCQDTLSFPLCVEWAIGWR